MKQINTLLYIFFAIYLLGNFANYAQNDYSAYPIKLSALFIAMTALIGTGILVFRCYEEKKSSALRIPILFLGLVICFFSLALSSSETLGISLLFTVLAILLAECIWINILNWKLEKPTNRLLALEYYCISLLFSGSFMKNMHWPGANIVLIIGSAGVTFVNIPQAIKMLIRGFRKEFLFGLISFLLYLNVVLASLFGVWKIQHWPGSGPMMWICVWILFIVLLAILRSQFRIGKVAKIPGFGKRLFDKSTSFMFLFVFTNYFVLYIFLQAIHIGPKAYNAGMPPARQKLYDEGHESRAQEYDDNYNHFIMNRYYEENK